MHLLDRAESDIGFVVRIEADIGRSEDEYNISPNMYNELNIRGGSVQQIFYYATHIE